MKIYRKLVLNNEFEVVEEDSYNYSGSIARLSGGGGYTTAELPPHIKHHHIHWITGEWDTWTEFDYPFEELLEDTLGADTPYTDSNRTSGAIAYNPDVDLTAMQDGATSYSSEKDSIGTPVADWGTFIDGVIAKAAAAGTFPDPDVLDTLSAAMADALTAAATAMASAPVTTLIAEYEAEAKARFQKEVSRWTAGMADINAVQTSSFIIGLSLQEREFGKSLDKYSAELRMKVFESVVVPAIQGHLKAVVTQQTVRDAFVSSATKELIALLQHRVQSYKDNAILQADVSKLKIMAKKEENDFNILLDVQEAKWDFDLFQYAGNFLAAPGGGVAVSSPANLSTMQSVLGGAATGASIGGMAGGIGAGAGALVGAGAGLLESWFR